VELYRTEISTSWAHDAGVSVDFKDEGLIQLFSDEQELMKYVKLLANNPKALKHATPLDRAELLQIETGLTGDFFGGIVFDEPWIDLDKLRELLALRISREPMVECKLSTRVERIETKSEVTAQLSDGSSAKAECIVIATGLGQYPLKGLSLPPMAWIRGEGIRVRPSAPFSPLARHVYFDSGFITPRSDGTYLLGSTYNEEPSIDSPELAEQRTNCVRVEGIRSIIDGCARFYEPISRGEIVRMWCGWRPRSPDGYPVLGRSQERVFLALGFLGLGITMAPFAGEVLAQVIDGADEATVIPLRMSASRPKASSRGRK